MKRWAVKTGAVLISAGAALQLAARCTDGFGEWYGGTVYPWIVGSLGRLCGLFPFSVSEIGLYMGAAGLLLFAVFGRQRRRIGSFLFLAAALLFFVYTACCGVNYYRVPFSEKAGIEVRESSLKELEDLCGYLAEQVSRVSAQREDGWYENVEEKSVEAMKKLGESYPQLSGFYPRPKKLIFSEILSVQHLSGIYSPFTVEANYNGDMEAYNAPLTACHELSHLRGFMREDEANFIGFLACIGSDDADFCYSGYLIGWIYAGNTLAARDIKAFMKLYESLPDEVREDLYRNTLFWEAYDGIVADAADAVNDTYLKINDQRDGVESYGRVVDLMLAFYREGAVRQF